MSITEERPGATPPAQRYAEFAVMKTGSLRASAKTVAALTLLARLLPEWITPIERVPKSSRFHLGAGAAARTWYGPCGTEYFVGPNVAISPDCDACEEALKERARRDPAFWVWANAPVKVDHKAVAAKRAAIEAAAAAGKAVAKTEATATAKADFEAKADAKAEIRADARDDADAQREARKDQRTGRGG